MTAIKTEEKLEFSCDICRKIVQTKPTKTGQARLPRNWQRFAEKRWCEQCWREKFKLRAVQIPCRMLTDELWRALYAAWRDSRAVANASVMALLKDDVVRTAAADKMPKPPQTYLYPVARQAAPGLDTRSVAAAYPILTR